MAPSRNGRSPGRVGWQRYLPAALVALAFVLGLGGVVASCGGMCSEVRALRDADPDWQSGSLPAIGTAFVGNEIAEMAANAWVISVHDDILGIVRGIPVLGPALTSAGDISISVDGTTFASARNNEGVAIVFDLLLEATPSARPMGSPVQIPDQLRRMAQVSVRLRVQAPIQIVGPSSDGTTQLVANLDGVRLSAVAVELGPLGAGVDPSMLLEPIQERLLRGRQLVIASIPPLDVSTLSLQMRPIRVRHTSASHFAVDVEFPDVAAPANSDSVPSLSGLPADALVLALPVDSALALGDYGLRVLGANGFNRRGQPGGAYAARLRDVAVQGEQVELTMDALRCRRPCASARIETTIETVGSNNEFRVQVNRTHVESATVPRPVVASALPGAQVLSERATAITREVLLSQPMEIPLLPTHQIVVQQLGARDGVIVGVARLEPASPAPTGAPR